MFALTLTAMFNGPLATPVRWRSANGVQVALGRGIYDEATELVEADGDITAPTLLIPTSLWPALSKGDTVEIGSRTFRVRVVRLEDDGAVRRLILASVS